MSFFQEFTLSVGILISLGGIAVISQTKGTGDIHGKNPADYKENKIYKPKKFSAIYMKIEQTENGSFSFNIKQQFFLLDKCGYNPVNEEDFSSYVQKIFFHRFRKNNWQDSDFDTDFNPKTPNEKICLPIANNQGYYQPSANMRELYYSEPLKIYVFIDNSGIKFQTAWPITFNKYSGDVLEMKSIAEWANFKRNKNDTFFNAKVGKKGGFIDLNPTPSNAYNAYNADQFLKYDHLYRSEDCMMFWCSDEGVEKNPADRREWPDGKPKYRNYAINYNLKVPTGYNNEIIPIAIDPDTGSGTGSPPPSRVNN